VGQAIGGNAAFDATEARGFISVFGMLLSHIFAIFFWSDALFGKANGQPQRAITAARPAAIIPRLPRLR
jgi:hypothetical protein